MVFLRENLFQIVALLVAVFNIWLASKLAPLATTVALVDQRVYAIERLDPISGEHFEDVIDRLDRIENKLDRYIELR